MGIICLKNYFIDNYFLTVFNEVMELQTPTPAEFNPASFPPEVRVDVPSDEMAQPQAEAAPAMSEADQLRVKMAEMQMELDKLRAERSQTGERPRSRAEIVAAQKEKIRSAGKKVKEVASVVVDEAVLLTNRDGRDIVWDDLEGVGREALRRVNEAKDKVVKKGEEIVVEVAKKGVEVVTTAAFGVADLTEYATAHINEPTVKALFGTARFFESLVNRTSVKVEDVMIGIQKKKERGARFVGRLGRVMEGINGVLAENQFGQIESMGRAANRLQEEVMRRREEASRKADEFRAAKREILMMEALSETVAENERQQAETRTRRANKFPRFVSRLTKLVRG